MFSFLYDRSISRFLFSIHWWLSFEKFCWIYCVYSRFSCLLRYSSSFFSSFIAEEYAIVQALYLIQNLPPKKYLIISDSQSILYLIMKNSFNSHISSLSFLIHSLITYLESHFYTVKFLYSPNNVGIEGNEIADSLTIKQPIAFTFIEQNSWFFTPRTWYHLKCIECQMVFTHFGKMVQINRPWNPSPSLVPELQSL